MANPAPVIVVPGVTATYLRDLYPLPPEALWTLLTQNFERVQLHPDDIAYEAQQPALVRADQLYEIAYKELIEELRHNLSPKPAEPTPVYPFGYDWRHPLKTIEAQLADFVDEVIDRTKLLRHYDRQKYGDAPKVNLVGHSMGGLVIAGYMETYGADKVDKIATLASPFRGSFEAMVKMATGTANMGGSNPSSREREAARVTPSLYHLFPDFDTGVQVDAGAGLPANTFDPALWQPSIVDTFATYIQLHSVKTYPSNAARREKGLELFKGLLDEASTHRQRITTLDLAARDFDNDRWLCVVGAGSKTRVRMTVALDRDKPAFRLTSEDRLDDWKDGGENTGDGTVHFKGAIPGFLPRESLVCVTPDDYGYWELADIAATRVGGFHGILPNMNMLHRLVVRHFTGAGDPRKNTWGRPAPGVAKADWRPAVRPLAAKG